MNKRLVLNPGNCRRNIRNVVDSGPAALRRQGPVAEALAPISLSLGCEAFNNLAIGDGAVAATTQYPS